MKKIITFLLFVIMTLSITVLTSGVYAADENGAMFSFSYPEKTNGIVDNKQTAKLSKITVDGEKVLKIVPAKESALVQEIRLDCFNLEYTAKDLEGAKYATIKYRYDGDASLTSPMLFMMFSGGGALEKNFTFTATEPTKSGEWALATFDISAIEGNINFEDGKKFKQIHIMPYGGWDIKVNDVPAQNVMYISDITFWDREPDMTKIKLPAIKDKFDYADEIAAQEDALTEKPPLTGDENGLLFSFNYADKNNGIVEAKKTATVAKVMEDDKKVLRVIPSPETALTDFITLDCYSVKYRHNEIVNANFIAITYKYITPTVGGEEPERMHLTLHTSGGALKTPYHVDSQNTIKRGVWTTAIFNISGKPINEKPMGYFQQFHLMPYGSSKNVKDLTAEDIMYIGDISFYTINPDPNALYSMTFRKGTHPDITGGGPNADTAIKKGEKLTLPEAGFTCGKAPFAGWRCSADNSLYPAGSQYLHIWDEDVIFSAEFDTEANVGGYKELKFIDYANGSVDRRDNITVTKTIFQNKDVVKIVPNPNGTKADTNIMVDGYSYAKSGIDIDEYKYMVITYYFDGKFPYDTVMTLSFVGNKNGLTKGFGADSSAPLTSGRWNYAVFDISKMSEFFKTDTDEHMLQHMQLIPLGWKSFSKDYTGNEAMYIAELRFYKEDPQLVTHESYMKGYDGGIFKPQGNMTRAEACTIVARLAAGSDELVPSDKTTAFADVPADQWYYKYVSYVESLGYLKAYSGNFLPNQAITRAEFVELVYNMGLLRDAGKNGTFTDVAADHPRAAVVSAAGKAGLVNGYANGDGTFSFKPDNTITRAEVVKVINNAYGRSITADMLPENVRYTFNDVEKSFWAYADIMEATLSHAQNPNGWDFCMVDPLSIISKTDADIDFAKGEAYLKEVDALAAKRIEEIKNTPNMDDSLITGIKYYVSNNGNDENDGKTPETAWKTMAKVEIEQRGMKKGDAILFERGGVWREPMNKAKTGMIYSAYGEGPKPRLYASPENGADASKWTLLEGTENIWVYATEMIDVGGVICDEGKAVGLKEIPDLYDGKFFVRTSNHTVEFDVKKELNENYEFFCDIPTTAFKTQKGKLYFRCDEGNPGEIFNQIEFNIGTNIIRNDDAKDVIYDNLCFMYAGVHGISSGSTKNITVQNCEFAWIGGGIQSYNNGKAGRLGNGFEVYGSVDGFKTVNNYIYQCYDAGATHQVASGGTQNISFYNILYADNVIEDCVYNIEYFGGQGANDNVVRDGKNFVIKNNILRRAGYGWGNQRPDSNTCANIKSWTHRNEYEKGTYTIENNILDRSMWKLSETTATYDAWCPVYNGNTYIQYIGGGLVKQNSYDLAYDCNAEAIVKFEIGDENAVVYFLPESYKHDGFLTR